ncbi:MAG: NTP transferase domain-containing protein [Exilispira sp.]
MKCIILAAGKGKRLQSEKFQIPKALRELNGKPILSYVLENIYFIDKKDIVIVIGFMGEMVIEKIGSHYTYVWQNQQLGTGHAVLMAKEYFDNDLNLILMGDMPFIKAKTIVDFIEFHNKNKNDLSILTVMGSEDSSFGRIIRNKDGLIEKIVEVKDATDVEKKIKELNTGIMICNIKVLSMLDSLKTDNSQKEYYLTDLVKLANERSYKIDGFKVYDEIEFFGINTLEDLEFAEEYLKKQ